MTDKEVLLAIREEIRRLRLTNPSEYNYQNAEGYIWALDDVEKFLDTLDSPKNGLKARGDFRRLYAEIAKSQWFKNTYSGKSLGDFAEMYEDADTVPKNEMPPSELCDRINPKAVGWPEEEKQA